MIPRRKRRLVIVACVTSFAMAIIGVVACSSEPQVNYGNPGNLKKDNLPGEAGIQPLNCVGEAGIADAGTGDACVISWQKDIWANMVDPKGWQCANSSCHAPGATPPAIDPKNAGAALTSLKAYTLTSKPGQPYIDTSGDPTKSTIECNLSGECSPAMPSGAGRQLTDGERCNLHAWLSCGAPNN